jgi:hypothetical protein
MPVPAPFGVGDGWEARFAMAHPNDPPERPVAGPQPDPSTGQHTPDLPEKRKPKESDFDIWLRRALHELFGSVAAEPVPRSLLRLLGKDREQ